MNYKSITTYWLVILLIGLPTFHSFGAARSSTQTAHKQRNNSLTHATSLDDPLALYRDNLIQQLNEAQKKKDERHIRELLAQLRDLGPAYDPAPTSYNQTQEPSAPRLELVTNPTFSGGYATPFEIPERTFPIPLPEPIIQPQAAGEDSQQRFANLKKAVIENGRILQEKRKELDRLTKEHAGNPQATARLAMQDLEREIQERQNMRHMVLEPLMEALSTKELFLELSKKREDELAKKPQTEDSQKCITDLQQQMTKLIREAWEKVEKEQQTSSPTENIR